MGAAQTLLADSRRLVFPCVTMSLDDVAKREEKIIQKARNAIGETDKIRIQTLQMMRDWIQKQPHLSTCPTTDMYLLNFARACKYRMEQIKRKLDMFMSMRAAIPEYFSGWDPYNPEIQASLKLGALLPLLERDQFCRKVIIMRPGSFDPVKHKPILVEKANFMIGEVMGLLDPTMFITGVVVIVDMKGYNLNHLNQRPLPMIKKYMRYTQEALPIRPQSVHFIQMPSSVNTLYNLIMGFATEKIKKRFKVHKSDLNTLYKDIPRNILPVDYGGDGPSIAELTGFWKGKVEENHQFLARMERVTRADESKRPGTPKRTEELFGMEGSFRKLEID